MNGYTKLFGSILASTIWREPDTVRIVWITLLAMSDKNGDVATSVPGLSDFARVSMADCVAALDRLMSPDEFSRTSSYQGRRIKKIDGGFAILNHGKYRQQLNLDERREYERVRKNQYRKNKRSPRNVRDSPGQSRNVPEVPAKSALSAQAEADASTYTDPTTEDQVRSDRARESAPAEPHWRSPSEPISQSLALINGSDQRRHGQHAFCGRMCVTFAQHKEFINRLGGDTPDATLKAWYPSVLARFEGQPIGDGLFEFWNNAFASWVGTVTSKAVSGKGNASRDAAARYIRKKYGVQVGTN